MHLMFCYFQFSFGISLHSWCSNVIYFKKENLISKQYETKHHRNWTRKNPRKNKIINYHLRLWSDRTDWKVHRNAFVHEERSRKPHRDIFTQFLSLSLFFFPIIRFTLLFYTKLHHLIILYSTEKTFNAFRTFKLKTSSKEKTK